MIEEYTIEQLEKTFKEHSENLIRSESEAKECNPEDYKEYYGEKGYFNMSEALHVICREINQLKSLTAGRRYEILDNFPID